MSTLLIDSSERAVASIRHLHTLGPSGTNLEAAAHAWLVRECVRGDVSLHASLEVAIDKVPDNGEHALVACAVYPYLHTLVFDNLHRMTMVDSFVMPTYNMVLATTGTTDPATVATHPAPQGLVPAGVERFLTSSNSQAAIECADGRADGCVTTIVSAEKHNLEVIRDFGPVPMVFTIHHVRRLI